MCDHWRPCFGESVQRARWRVFILLLLLAAFATNSANIYVTYIYRHSTWQYEGRERAHKHSIGCVRPKKRNKFYVNECATKRDHSLHIQCEWLKHAINDNNYGSNMVIIMYFTFIIYKYACSMPSVRSTTEWCTRMCCPTWHHHRHRRRRKQSEESKKKINK